MSKLETYEALTTYGAPVRFERNADTGETIATFHSGNKFRATVAVVPEFTGNTRGWLKAATVDADGMNWRAVQK